MGERGSECGDEGTIIGRSCEALPGTCGPAGDVEETNGARGLHRNVSFGCLVARKGRAASAPSRHETSEGWL